MNLVLLIISVIVYASFGLKNMVFILFSIITSFYAAKKMTPKNKKFILSLVISVNAVLLILFKVYDYVSLNYVLPISIILPLGISYYTLQVISYLVDVYRAKYPATKSILSYALYIFYFPCLFLGPINRYDEFTKSLNEKQFSLECVVDGIFRVCIGLFKKFIIAGRISIIIASITGNSLTGGYALLAMILYSFLLYSDFSGGIDIVLGASHIFGITLRENFDRPYFSSNLKEFWRRWHMSLSSWLRDYIYIPLGGNRLGKKRQKINLIITFLISGFWHGMNYLLWGAIHGVCVSFSGKFKTKFKVFNTFITFLIVSILWAFFIWPNSIEAIKMIISIFTTFNYIQIVQNISVLGLSNINILILILSILILLLCDFYKEKLKIKIKKLSLEWKISIIFTLTLIILVFGIYGIGFQVEEFIYSRF